MNNRYTGINNYRIGRTIFTTSIIGLGLLLVLAGCGPQQNGTGSQPGVVVTADNNPPTSILGGVLTDLHMIDATNGWAQLWHISGDRSYTILRTTDGGQHWKGVLKCLPTQGLGKGFIEGCASDYLSATIATIVQPEGYGNKPSQLRIFHTSDGGQTWNSAVIQAQDLQQKPPSFSDALHGLEVVTEHFPGPDPASSYIGQNISVYRTSDGGKSWQRVATGPATPQIGTSDDGYGVTPLTATAQVRFVTASTAFLAGTTYQSPQSSTAWLYVTHDSGVTWQQGFSSSTVSPGPPRFFTAQDGLFVAGISGSAPNYMQETQIYTTHDGGQTWTGGPVITVPIYANATDFTDLNHAWIAADNNTFYTTSDGGRHWTLGHIHTTYKRITNFSFVSPTLGWALADNRTTFFPEPSGGLQKGDIIYLLKTTDGGVTWHEIAHSTV